MERLSGIIREKNKAFGLIEMVVALGIWLILISVGSVMFLGGLRINRLSTELTIASSLAAEGIDAVNAIKKQGWSSPFLATNCLSGCGVATVAGTWNFSGLNNVLGKYTRQLFVTTVNRDSGTGEIVSSGGTIDPDTYKLESRVTWSRNIPPITDTISVITYVANFAKSVATHIVGGILVYGDGTTTPKYRTYDKTANSFGAEGSTVAGTSGRTFVIKTSPTKTEAVAGYTSATGVLQIMCFDGTTWSNDFSVTVGGTSTTRRFDIAYETSSGDAMVMYSTNTATTNELAYRTKSGGVGCGSASWSAATNVNPVRTTGVVQWIKMAWDKRGGQNLITALWADDQSDLSAMVWSGSAWGNEPSVALATSLQILATPQDVEDFDVEYESLSGDVMVVWGVAVGVNTNGVRYATCSGGTSACTWSGVLTPPTLNDDATNLDISANPSSDEVVFASVGINQNDLQIGYWSGSTWTNTANADTSCNSPTAGSKTVASGWLISGATVRSVVRYADQGSSAIDWYTGNAGVFTKEVDFAISPAPSGPVYYQVEVDEVAKDQLMSLVSDGANDLFAKRLTMTAAPIFTWTNSDGTALSTILPQNITNPYSFAYWRQ